MAPLRGWGPKGKRLRGFAPQGHWRTLTFLGALRLDRLAAPCVFDGPINGQCFRAYVEQQLLPVLEPGDIVVMDNLGSHKSAAIRQMIRAAGARLWYLPPYSPDLNPIEQAFAKIKHWMRSAQKRSLEETWRHVGFLASSIEPHECSNYFANAGYASVIKALAYCFSTSSSAAFSSAFSRDAAAGLRRRAASRMKLPPARISTSGVAQRSALRKLKRGLNSTNSP